MITVEARQSAAAIADTALARVRDRVSGRARVEDFLAVLAAITGEAVLVDSGAFDIENNVMTPGGGVFGDRVNDLLSGDQLDPNRAPAESVVGILVAELVPGTVPIDAFGSLEAAYRLVASSVGTQAWGTVATSVPSESRPTILPLQVAFELRLAVETALAKSELPANQRHVLCALALAQGVQLVRGAMDLAVGVRLAIEVAFGMAHMVPMSQTAFRAATQPGS